MTRPRNIHDILGTSDGDDFLRNPSSANDLYRSLVGTPMRDSLMTSIGEKPALGTKPWDVFDPIPEPEISGPVYVTSERIGAPAPRTRPAYFSSRDECPGVGYPSCCRALARIPKPMRDPNGYYRYIGVVPSASKREIKKALRKMYRRYHPDTGWAPDGEEFRYLREIASVLTNDRRRERYNNLADGERWLDSRVRKELGMFDDAIIMEHLRKEDEERRKPQGVFQRNIGEEDPVVEGGLGDGGIFRVDRQEAMRHADAATGNDHFDWFSDDEAYGDRPRAQLWYWHLVAVAPIFRYTRPIRVWLQDGGEPSWSDLGGILRIPRSWKIGRAEAFALFAVVIR